MTRVLVTGAAGFVGGAVVDALLRLGCTEVIATCRRSSDHLRTAASHHPALRVLDDIDLAVPGHVARLPVELTHVVHAAALARFEAEPAALERANVGATRVLLAHLAVTSRHSLQRLIYVSTFGVHDRRRFDRSDEPISEESPFAAVSAYGRSKHAAERLVRVSGLPHAIVRLAWIYGAEMRADSHIRVLASMCRARHPLTGIDFPGRVSTASVEDAGNAIAALLLKQPALRHVAYLIAHQEPVSFGDMFSEFHRILGRDRPMIPVRWLAGIARVASPVFPMKLRSLCEDYYVCSTTRLSEEGITMPTPFARGIRDTVAAGRWFEAP
jgi:2-alkyl-3-oxoalkanoate reductase